MTSIAAVAALPLSEAHQQALLRAGACIAPDWPLDRWIAVSPWWGMKASPIEAVDARLEHAAGVTLTMPAAFYREAWASGRIRRDDLQRAIDLCQPALDEATLLADLERAPEPRTRLASAWELAAEGAGDPFAPVAECCADYFDQHQQHWASAPDATLYGWWHTQTRHDRRLDHALREQVAALPGEPAAAKPVLVAALALSPEALERLVHTLLLRVNGWASWCQGLAWHTPEAAPHAGLDVLIVTLLAWERLGLATLSPRQQARWRAQWNTPAPESGADSARLWCWQCAYELGYQRRLAATLAAPPLARSAPAQVQAAFCIDVRSERLRRHLEQATTDVDTLGIAGFFGMPIDHAEAGPARALPRVPGLLTPRCHTAEAPPQAPLHRQRYQRQVRQQGLRHATQQALSTFTLVEMTGLAWGWKLWQDSRPRPAPTPSPAAVTGPFVERDGALLSLAARVELAEGLLHGLGPAAGEAPLLVLVGHDSQSDNNPYHAGLTCGACGGQGGGVNARLAAQLLNDPALREGLAARGRRLADTTYVLAATHCTLTDQVTLHDGDAVPATHRPLLQRFVQALARAGRAAREERAGALGVVADSDAQRLARLQRRGRDWSQPRPEWGLANNAALLLAPRAVSRGLPLDGRVFLHEYHPQHDPEGQLLEALMTAPMLVAHWINLQYYGSVAVPTLYGAGNKLLHSVVGGRLGVIEGNSPQLRSGLPHQSVHDGSHWRHEPLRLTVVIDAPRERIEGVLARQDDVAQLVNHRWLWLCRRTAQGLERYTPAGWQCLA